MKGPCRAGTLSHLHSSPCFAARQPHLVCTSELGRPRGAEYAVAAARKATRKLRLGRDASDWGMTDGLIEGVAIKAERTCPPCTCAGIHSCSLTLLMVRYAVPG